MGLVRPMRVRILGVRWFCTYVCVWIVWVPVGTGVRIMVTASAVKNEGNVLAFSVGFGVLIGAVSHKWLSKFRLSGRFLDMRRRPYPLSRE